MLFFLLLLGGGAAVILWPRTVPFDECSEIYKKYAGVENVKASFIKDYKVNDTVFVDVTILEATTDSMWHILMRDFNIPSPSPFILKSIEEGKKLVSTKYVDKTHYSMPDAPYSSNCEIMALSHATHSICVFHTVDTGEHHAILHFNIGKSINQ